MKQVCFFIIALLASAVSLYAQTEAKGDSYAPIACPTVRRPKEHSYPKRRIMTAFSWT